MRFCAIDLSKSKNRAPPLSVEERGFFVFIVMSSSYSGQVIAVPGINEYLVLINCYLQNRTVTL